jgi:serine/threonine-protein kinase
MTIFPGTRLGRYEIRSQIGAGGMGNVYLSQDTQLRRPVALKLLPPNFTYDAERLRRFEQEAFAASALNHPNIVTIHDIGSEADLHYIAIEFIEGETLRNRIEHTRVQLGEAIDIAAQVASALTAAHAAGIVHRDIKPENIMVRTDGYVKVLDFGLVKLTERQAVASEATTQINTDAGVVIGTVSYMSPEQARGKDVDARTDIWSLGVVLYEMMTGHRPFVGETTTDVFVSILEREPELLANYSTGVTSELQGIIEKALRKDREQRYQTAKELALDLRDQKQELEIQAKLGHSISQRVEHELKTVKYTVAADTKEFKEAAPLAPNSRRTNYVSGRRRSRKAINSLAVLPLVNVGADLNAEYLSDGITESIINSLSQLPKLRVMARSTVFRYKGREVDPQEVGRNLGVRAVLTGRMHKLDGNVVIGAELVDVTDGSQLWGEKYNRELSDIFALQEEISNEISEKLRLKLTGEEQRRLTKRYTENTEAYQLYLKGRYYWNKRTIEGFKKAIEYFNQAIEEDPSYALAYAGLADCYALLGSDEYGALPAREAMPKAQAAAAKALQIDEEMAEAHVSLAYAKLLYDWDWANAKREYKRAIELNPNYATAHHWYAITYLTATGQHTKAISEMRRACSLDPLSLIINSAMAWAFYFARRYDEAIDQYRKTIEMDPNFSVAYVKLGWAYGQKSMYEEAIREFEKVQTISGVHLAAATSLGHTYAVSGKRVQAQEALDSLKELSKRQHVPPYDIALIHTGLGENDQAFEWLQKACEERSSWLIWLKVDPRLDSLRTDPRFMDLVRRVGFKR